MNKVLIITLNDYSNYGNRLQNYALTAALKRYKIDPYTLHNVNRIFYIKEFIKYFLKKKHVDRVRYKRFYKFSKKYINVVNLSNINFNEYDYFIVGSDQVWNPNYALTDMSLLKPINSINKISYAASFGVSELQNKYYDKIKKELSKFKAISVRENAGKEIIKESTGITNVEVLIDPTMLLTAEEWDKISKKPKKIGQKKYILNYFLGELSNSRKEEIERIAKENDCIIINILNKKDPFYTCAPSEFLYLEKHAFLICTDSFHSTVFAILYNKPFIVFEREDNSASMNSRIETLLNKFMLQDRKYSGKIEEEQLKHNYENAYKILEKEKQKAYNFLNTALDIKENEIERK